MGEYDSKHYFPTFCKILEKSNEQVLRKLQKTVKKGHLCVNQKEWCVEPYVLDKY